MQDNTVELEHRQPIYAIENDCIISKCADVTVAYQVELPEIFTLTAQEYDNLHSAWSKAIKILPEYCIVHKQDWFIEEEYTEVNNDGSYFTRSFERHFYERPYLNHSCYLYLTQSTRKNFAKRSSSSSLLRPFIPIEPIDPLVINKFMDAVGQFEAIMVDSGIKMRRLTNDQLIGSDDSTGLLEQYFSLSVDKKGVMTDIRIDPTSMYVGDRELMLHTISDVEIFPSRVSPESRYDKYSTDKSTCNLSFASPIGLLLSCNHIYNQYLYIEDTSAMFSKLDLSARKMRSLAKYSRSNEVNSENIERYLMIAHENGLQGIRAHFNVLAWGDQRQSSELRKIKNEVGSQIAKMGFSPRHNTIDLPTIFWGGCPGNASDLPSEETFTSFIEPAVCMLTNETNYRSSFSPFGVKMVDRYSHKPLHLDISDLPMKTGVITNRNKFILGPSGSGKSFLTNHIMRQYYEQGAHIVLVDVGNSYKGLCEWIHNKSEGQDGVYLTYTEEHPISFNPFYTDDKIFDVEKKESLKTLILALWKKEDENYTRSEEVHLSTAINNFLQYIKLHEEVYPCFNTFYEYVRDDYQEYLTSKKVREKDFDCVSFLQILEPFYKGGEFDYLLNSFSQIDLLHKRFVVFELDNIKDHKILFPVVTIIIMEVFINKMKRLDGIRKVILIEEAWKAIAKEGMAEYIKYLFKTVRKYFGEAIVVTQEVDDIIDSPIVKNSIINNSDCKILLDQRKYLNKFEQIQGLLGLTEKQSAQVLSINQNLDPKYKYKEVYIDLGGIHTAVYACEVSPQEYYLYTTEQTEKIKLMNVAKKYSGDIELAVRELTTKN